MEKQNEIDSDNSLVDSLDEEIENEGGGYFSRTLNNNINDKDEENENSKININSQNNNNNNLTQNQTQTQTLSQNINYQNTNTNNIYNPSYTLDEEQVVTTNPETDMINFANYYKKFIRDPGIEGRKASRLLFLRSFNNWVKAAIINKYTYLLGKELSILDLCCGRGGDLEKYFRCGVRIYVGADLSEESLKNAMDRIVKLKSEKFKNLSTKCFFITEDVSDPNNNLMKKIPNEFYFDLISCQFAMHYHFENEIKVRAFLENVTSKLNEGGYFIGTIIDSNVLVKRLRNRKYSGNKYINEKFTFGNEFYSVKFYQKRFPKENGPYGIKYGFYLEDSIDKRDEFGKIKYVGEYLVIFENFVRLCKEYDLQLVERKNFTEFYEENMENKYYRNLFRKMIKEINVPTRELQWEIIQLYQVFVFRKGKPKDNKRYLPVLKSRKIEFKDFNPVFIEDKFE
jgi:mRNA (guanine-N7-)-methyltransferase